MSTADPLADKPAGARQRLRRTSGGPAGARASTTSHERAPKAPRLGALATGVAGGVPLRSAASDPMASSESVTTPLVPIPADDGELDIDMAENDFDGLAEEDCQELATTYAGGSADVIAQRVVDDIVERVAEPLEADAIDNGATEVVAAGLEDVPGVVDDVGDPSPGLASASSSCGPVAEEEPMVDEAPPPLPPCDRMEGPSSSGYVYFEGRSAMRIQRNRPLGRLTLSCYKHPKCTLLVNLDRAPTDEDLKRWFFEGEAAPPGSDKNICIELGRKHLQAAKDRWVKRN